MFAEYKIEVNTKSALSLDQKHRSMNLKKERVGDAGLGMTATGTGGVELIAYEV